MMEVGDFYSFSLHRLGLLLQLVGFILASPEVLNELIGSARLEKWRKTWWSRLNRTFNRLLEIILPLGVLLPPSDHDDSLINAEAKAMGLGLTLIRLHYVFSFLFTLVVVFLVPQILADLYELRIFEFRDIPLSVLFVAIAVAWVIGASTDVFCLTLSKQRNVITLIRALKIGLFFPILKSHRGTLRALFLGMSVVLYPVSSLIVVGISTTAVITLVLLMPPLILLGALRLCLERSATMRKTTLLIGVLCVLLGFLFQFLSRR